jgi:AcrR family transcriptional regulator
VGGTSIRERKVHETRARIAEAALDSFVNHGYADTTIDDIAEAAGVSRRTVFRHFATKEAILLDHLAARRDFAVRRLLERPQSEPPLVSLHAVFRELAQQGYERRLLIQIRQVLRIDPRFAEEKLGLDFVSFRANLIAALENRTGNRHSAAELLALTEMAQSWFIAAIRLYFKRGKGSLVEYFDEAVEACVRPTVSDLGPMLGHTPSSSAARKGTRKTLPRDR